MATTATNITLDETSRQRLRVMLLCAVIAGLVAKVLQHQLVSLSLLTISATLLALCLRMWLRARSQGRHDGMTLDVIARFVEQDATPSFIARSDGTILSRNAAAEQMFANLESMTLPGLIGTRFANPSGVLFRLQSRASAAGSAQEDLVTGGGHMRLSVQQLAPETFVWRLEPWVDRAPPAGAGACHALPMLMAGRDGAILFMNDAAQDLLGHSVKSWDRLFTSLPYVPGRVTEISAAEGPRKMLVAEVPAGAGRKLLYFLPPADPSPPANGANAFQDLPIPLLKVDRDGRVKSYNTMAARLIGEGLQANAELSRLMEGLGRSITDWLRDTLSGRMTQKSEFLRLSRTDREVFVQVTLNRVTEDGEPALIAALSDATELKSLEAQFVQSQKMQAIGQLAGGVAHDFNNLLTAISGHCDLLLLRHDQGHPNYGDLVQINQNANRAAALVGQLLAFSRKQTLRPETIDLRDTLADLTHLLNRLVGEKVTLTLRHDPELQPLRADKRQLEQVLMNLVVNARDALPEGGEIRIITEKTNLAAPMTRDRVTVPAGDYIAVKVEDDGTGIPSDKLQKIFEPFFTTKRTGEGTGLGLSTAYGIVKQTGGYIFVDSTVGRGTTFSLLFPALSEKETARPKPALHQSRLPSTQDDGIILLVEDEAPVRAFASRALRLRGYTVLEAESAEAALKTLEDGELKIDVFVTDVVMPGMDGPTWVQQALKDRPGVRVVFVSGYAEDDFSEEQTKIPNSVFLPKPFSLSDLAETVHRQMH